MTRPAPPPARPTLVSLARELGVSRQTVSNVINNPSVVRPETRVRVQQAIESSGYRPSAVGRALRSRRSMAIGLRLYPATDGINGAIKDRLLHNLTEEAQRHGYRLVLFTAADEPGEVDALEELHRISAIDACVITDTPLDDPRPARLASLGLPLVAFGRPWGLAAASHPWVDVDGASGTREATEHLRRLGHTRIGFIGWRSEVGLGPERRGGWVAGMEGLTGDLGSWSIEADESARDGARAASELLSRGVTALVCVSDSLALGAAGALRQESGSALGPVPVVGFDDTPVASALGLSSIAQPIEDAARELITTLLDLLAGHPAARDRQVLLPSRLVPRNLEPYAP